VFKAFGLPNAEEHLVKAQLVFKIDTIMKQRRLKQLEAASLFGVRQPDVSKMLRGDFRQFSVERLLRFLVTLDQDVEIVVKPRAPSPVRNLLVPTPSLTPESLSAHSANERWKTRLS
jgi:predicted XRE-type DNA-binding protein